VDWLRPAKGLKKKFRKNTFLKCFCYTTALLMVAVVGKAAADGTGGFGDDGGKVGGGGDDAYGLMAVMRTVIIDV